MVGNQVLSYFKMVQDVGRDFDIVMASSSDMATVDDCTFPWLFEGRKRNAVEGGEVWVNEGGCGPIIEHDMTWDILGALGDSAWED